MIPFFQANIILIGPLTIQVWGLFVSLGIVVGIILARILAKRFFLSPDVVLDLSTWALIGGIIGARLIHVFFYEPTYYLYHLREIIFIWQGGASSLGGFLGAGVALLFFAYKRKFSWKELLSYFDIMSLSLWLGWGIGRIGCFMIHDHIGRLSNSWIAVNYPGGARFDLGLLESLLAIVVFIVFSFFFKKLVKLRWGLVFTYSFIVFAVFRFGLDFLRATDVNISDVRWWFLTPMQWGVLIALVGLTFWLVKGKMFKMVKKE